MDDYDRINELKKLKTIGNSVEIKDSDLYLKDESNKTLLEYIVENNVSIFNDELLMYISNNYDVLLYMVNNNYFIRKYYNIDLLFDESKGESIIELIFKKRPYEISNMSIDIINRLFENNSGKYMIEKMLNQNQSGCIELIKKVTNFDTLYSCLSDMGKLDLMKYSNENCLLSKTSNGITMLEELINMGENINFRSSSYRVAETLYNNKHYQELLELDCSILVNYPDNSNNYLSLLINKFKEGENIPFNYVLLHSNDNRSLALANILLLKNNIPYMKPSINYLINLYDSDNYKPALIYMLEMDKDLTFQHFNSKEVIEILKKHIIKVTGIEEALLVGLDLNSIIDYLPKPENLINRLVNEKKEQIDKKDIYRDDLLYTMDDGTTILEYAFKNNIKIYDYYSPKTIREIIIGLKYDKVYNISENLLYEKIDDNKELIEYLIENQYFTILKSSSEKNLRIMDYCIKYNRFDIISSNILNELFVEHNGSFLAEKYLNNDEFLNRLQGYDLDKRKALKLYEKGYKQIMIHAKEDALLTKYNGTTILDDLLKSNMTPTFYGYDFKSPETIKILYDNNRPELMYNATLELLMNYPDKENNYMLYLIECHKKGINVNFEKKNYMDDDKELLARCYIQMTRNGLIGYLNNLEADNLISSENDEKSLLYYLIKIDRNITLERILNYQLKKSSKIFAELKLLGIEDGLLNISYDRFNCADMCRKVYNGEYDKDIESPVEELLEELRQLFENDGKSDKDLINALIIGYRYSTSVDPMFIEELMKLIEIKKNNPTFYYTKEQDTGYFNKSKGVLVEDSTISTLIHETGHAMHYYLTNFGFPKDYSDLLLKINADDSWISRIELYAKMFQEIKSEVSKKASTIVLEHIIPTREDNDSENIISLLSDEKDKIIQQYIERGYSRETLDIVLNGSFTLDEFVRQKKKIETMEVEDTIMRYDYDAFIAIGDIIDAISGGKFKSKVLKSETGEIIPSAYGHGIRYYSRYNELQSLEKKFTEMIANYATIIKSKNNVVILKLLRGIVGDELVEMLDEFYKEKIVGLSTNKEKNR